MFFIFTGTRIMPSSSSHIQCHIIDRYIQLPFFKFSFCICYNSKKCLTLMSCLVYTSLSSELVLCYTVKKCSITEYKNGGLLFTEESKCLPVNPCKNGGVCTEDLSGYRCNCNDGYNGINCEGITSKGKNIFT